MARRGVPQLTRLVLSYCDHSGSSRGARQFAAEWLPRFAAEAPGVAVESEVVRGASPVLRASYLSGLSRTVGLSNAAPEAILRQAAFLRSSAGRKASLQVKQRTRTRRPSIQGQWTGELQDTLLQKH